jgi:hypothetical protein
MNYKLNHMVFKSIEQKKIMQPKCLGKLSIDHTKDFLVHLKRGPSFALELLGLDGSLIGQGEGLGVEVSRFRVRIEMPNLYFANKSLKLSNYD